jgi:hypothetical protein
VHQSKNTCFGIFEGLSTNYAMSKGKLSEFATDSAKKYKKRFVLMKKKYMRNVVYGRSQMKKKLRRTLDDFYKKFIQCFSSKTLSREALL